MLCDWWLIIDDWWWLLDQLFCNIFLLLFGTLFLQLFGALFKDFFGAFFLGHVDWWSMIRRKSGERSWRCWSHQAFFYKFFGALFKEFLGHFLHFLGHVEWWLIRRRSGERSWRCWSRQARRGNLQNRLWMNLWWATIRTRCKNI